MPMVALAAGAAIIGGAVVGSYIRSKMKPASVSGMDRGMELARKLDNDYPREVALGRVATGGSGVYDTVSGDENKYLWRVTALSDYEITGFNALWMDGELVTLSGDPLLGWVDVTSHRQKKNGAASVRLRVMPGTETQALDSQLAAAAGPGSIGGELTAADTFAGMAIAILRIEFSQDDELTREPNRFVYDINGAPVHDPRDIASDVNDPSTWSRTSQARFNTALQIAQSIRGFKRNGEIIVGAEGVINADIPDADLIAEADRCDELVLTESGTEVRYRSGVMLRMDPRDGIRKSVQMLLDAMDGDLSENAGKFRFLAGGSRTPVAHFDLESIGGRIVSMDEHGSSTRRYNAAECSIVDPSAAWEALPLPTYKPAAFLTADGNRRRVMKNDLEAVYSVSQGVRIQRARLDRSRKTKRETFDLPIIAEAVEAGDWITVTDRLTGMTSGVWDVQATEVINDPERGPRVLLACSEIDATLWNWTQDDANGAAAATPPSYPIVGLPSVPVPVLTLTAINISGGSAQEPAIQVAAAFAESPLSTTLEFEWRQTANPTQTFSTAVAKALGGVVLREGISPNTEYQIRARLTGGTDRVGQWSAWDAVTSNATLIVPDSAALGGRASASILADVDDSRTRIANATEALQAGASTLEGAIDALRDAFAAGQTDAVGAVTTKLAAIQTATDDVLSAAELGDDRLAARLTRLAAPSQNLIADPWLKAGGIISWRDQDGNPGQMKPMGGYARQRAVVQATGAGAGPKLIYTPRRRVEVGETFEISAGVFTSGPATDVELNLAIFASETSSTAVDTKTVDVTPGSRMGSWTVTITTAGFARFEANCDTTGAGEVALELEAPVWRLASTGQSAISAAPSQEDATFAMLQQLQAVAANIATTNDRLRVANEHALAEVQAIVISQVQDGSALATQLNALTATVNGLSAQVTTIDTAVAGLQTEAARTSRLEVGAILNRIPDPLFDLAADNWVTDTAPPITVVESNKRLLRLERDVAAAGAAGWIEHALAIRVFNGQRLEWSPRIRLGGLASQAQLKARFTDLDGTDVSTDTGQTLTGTGWQEGLAFFTAPADGFVYPLVSFDASGAGLAWIDMDEPQLIGALDGQSTRSSFERSRSARAAEILEERRVQANAVNMTQRAQLMAGNAHARIEDEAYLRDVGDQIEAQQRLLLQAQLDTVEADLNTNYSTSASLALIYRTAAQVDAAITAFDLNLNSTFAALDGRVDGHDTDLANRYTKAEADLEFQTLAEVTSAITTFNLALNSVFSTLEGRVTGHDTDLANRYTEAEANALFMTATQVDSAIGAYTVTINAVNRTFADHLDHVEDGVDAVTADLGANYLTTAAANAAFMTSAETDAAIGSYTLNVNAATRTISGHLDHVEDGVDAVTSDLAANYLTTAAANAAFMTATEVDNAIGSITFAVNAATRTIAGHLDHVEDAADAVTADLAANYLTTAEANAAFTTLTEVNSAIASYTVSINAVSRTLPDHLDHIEDGLDATAADLSANYYTAAQADSNFMTSAEVDAAIAAYTISINAVNRTLGGHLDHIEDGVDAVAADLSANYYSAAQADAAFTTAAEVDAAIAAFDLDLNADFSGVRSSVTTNAGAISTIEGAAAFLTQRVAAAGSIPAIFEMRSGLNGSEAILGAAYVMLANLGAQEDEILPVIEAIGGEAFFSRPIHINDGQATPVKRVIVGPGSDWVMWFGPVSETASTATKANADFALGADGNVYIGGKTVGNLATYSQFGSRTRVSYPTLSMVPSNWASLSEDAKRRASYWDEAYIDSQALTPVAGAQLQVTFSYLMRCVKNAFEWFSWEEEVWLQYQNHGGTWVDYSQMSIDLHTMSCTVNTGAVPGGFAATTAVNTPPFGFTITSNLTDPLPSTLTVPSLRPIRARIKLRPSGDTDNGVYAFTATSFNSTLIRDYFRIKNAHIGLEQIEPGPTLIV